MSIQRPRLRIGTENSEMGLPLALNPRIPATSQAALSVLLHRPSLSGRAT
ncbi:hypothetical protein AVEN_137038-1, partial [Araneus ventricosus]